jgi:hypothetical protein
MMSMPLAAAAIACCLYPASPGIGAAAAQQLKLAQAGNTGLQQLAAASCCHTYAPAAVMVLPASLHLVNTCCATLLLLLQNISVNTFFLAPEYGVHPDVNKVRERSCIPATIGSTASAAGFTMPCYCCALMRLHCQQGFSTRIIYSCIQL